MSSSSAPRARPGCRSSHVGWPCQAEYRFERLTAPCAHDSDGRDRRPGSVSVRPPAPLPYGSDVRTASSSAPPSRGDTSALHHLLTPPRAAARGAATASWRSSTGWARSSSTRSASPVATTTSCSTPGSPIIDRPGRTSSCTSSACSSRRTTRRSASCRPRSCRTTASAGTDRDRFYAVSTLATHAEAAEHILARIRAEGPLSTPRLRARTGHRLVLGTNQRDACRARGAVGSRASSASLGATATAATTTWWSACTRPSSSRTSDGATNSCATSCSRVYRANGLLGMAGSAELWYGRHAA